MSTEANQQYRLLGDYRDRIPGHRKNSRIHLTTLIRWATKGVAAASGARIRLRAVRVGTKWLTTDSRFDEFVSAITAPAIPATASPAVRSSAQRNRDSDTASDACAAAGY